MFSDPGIRRAILGKWGAPDGAELESAVVAEVYKRCGNARLRGTWRRRAC